MIVILITAIIITTVVLLAKRRNKKQKEEQVNEVEVVVQNESKEVLDEKESIKQAEEIVRRRKRYTRILKLSLTVILLAAIEIVAGIFFFDTYKANNASFHNATSKEYWNTLPGFEHYDDIYEKYVETANVNSPKYISPFDYSESIYTNIKKARYKEELDLLIAPYKTELRTTKDEERKLELEKIIDESNLHSATLLDWNKYKDNEALTYQKVAENDGYEFWLHMGLTTFKVYDKVNDTYWYSNPETYDTGKEDAQKDVLKIWYSKTGSNSVNFGTYNYSTSTSFRGSTKDVNPNFAVKVITEKVDGKDVSTIQVWYRLEERGVNWTYFPKYVSKATYDALVEENARLVAEGAQYDDNGTMKPVTDIKTAKFDEKKDTLTMLERVFTNPSAHYKLITKDSVLNQFGEDYYEYNGNLEKINEIGLNHLYMLYTHCGFTLDKLEEENTYFQTISDEKGLGLTVSSATHSNASFTVAVQYQLTEDGLNVTIPGNSISENGENLVVYIDLLEYFTAAPNTEDGYTIIPDGSGAVLNHNNGKISNLPYNKRLYTTDLSMAEEVMKASTEDIMLPMYAVVNTTSQKAVIADVIDGAAQMELYADISGRGNETHNRNYFRVHYHESQVVKVSSVMQPIDKYNNLFMNNDISIDFRFYGADVVKDGYSGIAHAYRDLLVKRYNMEDKKDTTDDLVIDIDVLGSYNFKNNVFGIVYNDKETLTTYEELQKMITDIESKQFKNINIFYKGWRNTTLVNTSFKNIKAYSALGKLSKLAEIEDMEGVNVYPYINFGQINKYQESFGSYHYNTRNVIGEIITIYPYDLQSNVWNKKAQKINILSPRYYEAFAQSLADSFAGVFKIGKKNEVLTNISLDSLGSVLTGDYQKNQEMFKINAVYEQIKALEVIKNAGITNINLYKPYDYAFPYVSNAKEIPYESTHYEILNYSIPFYQLVVNGLFDYSGESINANSEEGVKYHILRMLETGSNASFTFTYKGSEVLLKTDYNQYYYTEYSLWLEEVAKVYNEISATGISGLRLVKHEFIKEGVTLVTYASEDGAKQVQILINNTFSEYVDTVTGTSVLAMGYKVL